MVRPPPYTVKTPTGRFRVRAGRFNRPIIQIEELGRTFRAFDFEENNELHRFTSWRDATLDDFLRGVILVSDLFTGRSIPSNVGGSTTNPEPLSCSIEPDMH